MLTHFLIKCLMTADIDTKIYVTVHETHGHQSEKLSGFADGDFRTWFFRAPLLRKRYSKYLRSTFSLSKDAGKWKRYHWRRPLGLPRYPPSWTVVRWSLFSLHSLLIAVHDFSERQRYDRPWWRYLEDIWRPRTHLLRIRLFTTMQHGSRNGLIRSALRPSAPDKNYKRISFPSLEIYK